MKHIKDNAEMNSAVLSIMAGAAFDTVDQMNAAYAIADEALTSVLAAERSSATEAAA